MCAIGGIIEKAINDGYMSGDEGKRYAKEIQERPGYKQQEILAGIENLDSSLVKAGLNSHGIY